MQEIENKAALQAITIYNYKFIALKLIIQSIKFNPSNLLAWDDPNIIIVSKNSYFIYN